MSFGMLEIMAPLPDLVVEGKNSFGVVCVWLQRPNLGRPDEQL